MIKFIILVKKDLVLLFRDFINVTRFLLWKIYLTSCFENDVVILFSVNLFHTWPFFTFYGQIYYLALVTP